MLVAPSIRRLALVAAGIAIAGPALAQGAPTYAVKAPEVPLAAGDRPGDVRRTIQPYENWTTICDENLKKRRRVCNITQSIVGAGGDTVFNWSLAATQGGEPVLILRAPTADGQSRTVRLDFGGAGKPITLPLATCSAALCLGFLPLDVGLKRLIAKGAPATVSTTAADGQAISLVAPLRGLAAAIAGLK